MNAPENRAVAFLDVLGFRGLIAQAEEEVSERFKLEGLLHVIESHIEWDNKALLLICT